MAGDNAQQISDWNGAVGEKWAADQERTDQLIKVFGDSVLEVAKAAAGESVIDIGCGCGATSLDVARSVGPAGRVLGVDVSAAMLAIARRRAEGIPHLTFAEADASRADLNGPFDLMVSRFGVMFFDDPPAAFSHMRKALKAGGRLAFTCWQSAARNPWAILPAQAARKAAGIEGAPVDPHAPGPFAFGDADRLRGILSQAGFSHIAIEPFEAPMYLGSSSRSAAEGAIRIGPASRVVREVGPEKLPAIADAIDAVLAPFATADGSIALPGRTWIVTADSIA
jgi:SAM-dependent methyltransferase